MSSVTYTYSSVSPVRTFNVVSGGSYTINAIGAVGGFGAVAGGAGADIQDTFNLSAGSTLTIVVGGAGQSSAAGYGGGGGGGSIVRETFNSSTTTLLVAGGGGGGAGLDTTIVPTGSTTQNGAGDGAAGAGLGSGGGGGYSGGAGADSASSGSSGVSGGNNMGLYSGGAGYSKAGSGGYGGGGGGGYYGGGGGGGAPGGNGGSSENQTASSGESGGSFDSNTNSPNETFTTVSDGNGQVTITPLCFLRSTRILTPTGEVRVEDLQAGDAVVTRFGGIQPVRWIGRHSHPAGDPALTPVCIRAGALGDRLPARDLYVSPGHSVLVNGTLLIARLLVNGVTVTQGWCPPRIEYFHVELAAHDCVIAEGAWAETYADAQVSRAAFDNAAEYEALYPEAGPPPDEFTLCAPRPERGAVLEAALRPVVARIAVAPKALAGSIDRTDGAWRVQGWAHDAAHPDLPVLLEVELDGQLIGTVVACEERADLVQAGFGRGWCGFTFTSPVRLRPELLHSLRMRRVSDGAELVMAPRCQQYDSAGAKTCNI